LVVITPQFGVVGGPFLNVKRLGLPLPHVQAPAVESFRLSSTESFFTSVPPKAVQYAFESVPTMRETATTGH
jgi:hypothetical protein